MLKYTIKTTNAARIKDFFCFLSFTFSGIPLKAVRRNIEAISKSKSDLSLKVRLIEC